LINNERQESNSQGQREKRGLAFKTGEKTHGLGLYFLSVESYAFCLMEAMHILLSEICSFQIGKENNMLILLSLTLELEEVCFSSF
jgi:hypothetical protein